MAAVKNKPTATISMITKICLPEFSLSPEQSGNNKHIISKNKKCHKIGKYEWFLNNGQVFYLFNLVHTLIHF